MEERLPGGLSARDFLRRYWQRKPLLVRGALPRIGALLGRRALFSLARRPEVESRLVWRRGSRWHVEQGPLASARLARMPPRGWTLLVNGVNLHSGRAENLLRLFSFVPQARLDDVMVSYAAPGGGVGPHTDSYDVFLLQGPGRRVWRLERARRFAPEPGAPLRLIADFRPDEEYLLEAGDLLYLPPGWGHDGVALDACFTYSIGFRAPRGAELAAAFLDYLHERGLPDVAYRDPGLVPARRPAEIGTRMIEHAGEVLGRLRWSGSDVRILLGRYLTLPKPHVVFRPPRRPRACARRPGRSNLRVVPAGLSSTGARRLSDIPDTETPQPEYGRFDSEEAFQQAVDRLLEQNGRELRVFDPDLESLRLNLPERIARLERFLQASRTRRIYVVVHDTDYVSRFCPRLMTLLARYAHAMQIHRTHEEIRELQDAFLVLDASHYVRRPVAELWRGAAGVNDDTEALAMRSRFHEIWEASYPAVSGTTIGL